jgi:DNA-binding LytR/AlgR family response regulator
VSGQVEKGLRVLVVDDEQPALDELSWLLQRDDRVGTVRTASSAAEALRVLQEHEVDAVFSDIRMPGLSGVELTHVLRRFRNPPLVVFVTAYEEHAVEAFELEVADYLLKPVRDSRLSEAVRRVLEAGAPTEDEPDDAIPVELGGVTRFVRRSEVRYVEAQGDYARLHTPAGNPLIRVPLTTLEEEWRPAGFVRIHRSHLVALAHVSKVRSDGGRVTVVVDGEELTVSRRHTRELRDLLVRHSRPGTGGRT